MYLLVDTRRTVLNLEKVRGCTMLLSAVCVHGVVQEHSDVPQARRPSVMHVCWIT
jgi:hypothetical protein